MKNEEIYENVMGHKPNKEFGLKGSFSWDDIDALMTAVKNCSIPVISIYWLKLNHWLFSWYYKRVDKHFHSWTFIKSVKILIQNYQHHDLLFKNELKHNQALIKDNDKLRAEISQIKIEQIATDKQIRDVNQMFGTKWTPPADN